MQIISEKELPDAVKRTLIQEILKVEWKKGYVNYVADVIYNDHKYHVEAGKEYKRIRRTLIDWVNVVEVMHPKVVKLLYEPGLIVEVGGETWILNGTCTAVKLYEECGVARLIKFEIGNCK